MKIKIIKSAITWGNDLFLARIDIDYKSKFEMPFF
jgi:hypothetical protein